MGARLAIILAQIPIVFFLLYYRKRPSRNNKRRRILFLILLEFVCVSLALVLARIITGAS